MNEQLAYFQTQVLTASPPKLRLLLIEAALQLARQSLRAQEEAQAEPAFQGLHRLRKVILQLLTSLEDHDGGLGHTFQRVYLLLYRTVTEAQLSGNTQKTRDIVRILEVEQDVAGTDRALRYRIRQTRLSAARMCGSRGDAASRNPDWFESLPPGVTSSRCCLTPEI